MQNICTKDETLSQASRLHLPMQVEGVNRGLLATGATAGVEGIEPQIHIQCDEFGGNCQIVPR